MRLLVETFPDCPPPRAADRNVLNHLTAATAAVRRASKTWPRRNETRPKSRGLPEFAVSPLIPEFRIIRDYLGLFLRQEEAAIQQLIGVICDLLARHVRTMEIEIGDRLTLNLCEKF